jgi:hypothetical protein
MCVILIAELQEQQEQEKAFYVLGETFLRNFYVNLDFPEDKPNDDHPNYIWLAPSVNPPPDIVGASDITIGEQNYNQTTVAGPLYIGSSL